MAENLLKTAHNYDIEFSNLYTNAVLGVSVCLSVHLCVCLLVRYRNHLAVYRSWNWTEKGQLGKKFLQIY